MVTIVNADIGVRANNRRLSGDLRQSRRTISRELFFLRRDMQAAFRPIAQVATLALGGITIATTAALRSIDDLAKQARTVGLSAEQWQVYAVAAREAGANQDALVNGIRRGAEVIQEAIRGNVRYSAALAELGLNARDLAEQDPSQALFTITEALGGLDDQSRRLALGRILLPELTRFGTLLTIADADLQQIEERLIRIGARTSNETAARVELVVDQAALLGDVIRTQFAEGLVESLERQNLFGLTEDYEDALTRVGALTRSVEFRI